MKPNRESYALMSVFFGVTALLAATTSRAQPAAGAASDAATLAKYDANHNGRLDPDEIAAMQADEARAAQAVAPSRATAAGEEAVQLSPFEVTESNNGYYAGNTVSGTRLNTKLEDIGASISVVTKQQMADFAMLDINDVFLYEASTEGTGTYTAFEVDRNGMVTDQIMNNPQGSNRIRGVGAANIALENFPTSGRMPIDPLSVDALEISRGPNSTIFGLGEGSGTVNMVGATARLNRSSSTTEFRVDDLGGWRTSLDLNRPLIKDKLGARVSFARQHDGFQRKPSGFDTKRFNAMIRAQPFRNTSIRASYQAYIGHGTRANTITPRDAISYWKSVGSPTWDSIANAVTVGGVTTVMSGATNPAGLQFQNFSDPIRFVDNGGIQLWEVSRIPAATATNGPNNLGGVTRMLESQPDPIRTGRPLWSTIPGLSDRSIYDYTSINLASPNYLKESDEISTVNVEQYLLNTARHKLAFQLAWQREDADRVSRNFVGSASATGNSFYLYVDPNSKLTDGKPNPYYLKPYVGVGEPVTENQPYQRDSYRSQGLYVLDFTNSDNWPKWLGRHQLLGYYEERKTKQFRYRYRDVNTVDNAVYAPAGQPKGNQSGVVAPIATRGYFHFYAGSNATVTHGPSPFAFGPYTFNWYNTAAAGYPANSWVADHGDIELGGINEGTAGSFASLTLIKTKGGTLQSTLFDGRLITTFGRRQDENRTRPQKPSVLQSNGWQFDYVAMDGWGVDPTTNDGDPLWGLRTGKTKQSGVVSKPFRNWSFTSPERIGGFVSQLLNGLTVYYNKSDSFRPETPAIAITLEDLPNPTSQGKDYGFWLTLGSKLSIRANKYTTTQINSRAGQSAIFATRTLRVDFANFAGNNDAISLQRQARNWISQTQGLAGQALEDAVAKVMGLDPTVIAAFNNNVISETSDVIARGNEIEINYNPNNYWTVRANVTREESIDANLSPHIPAWIAQRTPTWEKIIDPRTGNHWFDQPYSGDNPATSGTTPRSFLTGVVISPLAITQANEGKSRPEVREWHVNVSTNYRLAGLTDNAWLKRLNVGGAARWESKGAIGYYSIPVNGDYGAATQLDPNRPIWNSPHTYLDAFVGYTTRVYHDKWRARFQLNVRDLQESGVRLQKIGAYPDGRGHTFRIVDPRLFIFTATFDL